MKKDSGGKVSKKKALGILVVAVLIVVIFLVLTNDQNSEEIATGSVVAVVNGENVLEGDVERVKTFLAIQTGDQVDDQSALERAISDSLILQESRARGIEVTRKDAEGILKAQLAQQGMTLEQLKQDFDSKGEDYEKALTDYMDGIAIEKLIRQVVMGVEVSDEEARAYYDANKQVMFQGEIVPYENVAEQLKIALLQTKEQAEFAEYVQGLREAAVVEYL